MSIQDLRTSSQLILTREDSKRRFLLVMGLSITFFLSCPIEPMHSAVPLWTRTAFCFGAILTITARKLIKFKFNRLITPAAFLLALMYFSQLQSSSKVALENLLAFSFLFAISLIAVSSIPLNLSAIGIALGGVAVAVYCIFFSFVNPELSWMNSHFIGAFLGWNNLALTLIFAIPAALTMNIGAGIGPRLAKLLTLSLLSAEILAAGSTSSSIVLASLCSVYGAIVITKKSRIWGVASATALLLLASVVLINAREFIALLGKSSELSGRVPIWFATLNAVKARFLTGYGWEPQFGFTSPVALVIQQQTGYFQMHTHNDLLQWFATVGVLGSITVLFSLLSLILIPVFRGLTNRPPVHPYIFIGGLGLMLGGIAEISVSLASGWLVFSVLTAGAIYYSPIRSQARKYSQ